MREEIQRFIGIAAKSTGHPQDPPLPQKLIVTLTLFGEMLSQALDRIEKLESGGLLKSEDILGDKDILKK